MKTGCFDAVVNISPVDREKPLQAQLLIQGIKIPASLYFYEPALAEKPGTSFVRIHCQEPLLLKWKDIFKVKRLEGKDLLEEGLVLNPFSEKINKKKIKKRIAFLECLQGDEEQMLFALIKEKRIKGLKEREAINFSSLTERSLLRLTQELEQKGRIKILSFSPLFLISQESFDFLCQKILTFLVHFHNTHPEEPGVSMERVEKRFDLHSRILSLALKHLVRTGQIKALEDIFSLSDFMVVLTPEKEKILKDLEEMCFKGEFCTFSFEELQKHFRLSSKKLDSMLSLLIERKKIVQGKDGLILHSRWLDKIISRIKKSGKRELTVADFKEMTGLSRKYAIPLLELLDQMGVTRRKGSLREIL